jgi:hypothetical protein
MALDPQFVALMKDTITVEPFSSLSTDGYNARVYGTVRTMKARVEQKIRLLKDAAQRQVISTTQVYTPPVDTSGVAYTFTMSDRMTLPAAYGSIVNAPPIISVERHVDQNGEHMYSKVYL